MSCLFVCPEEVSRDMKMRLSIWSWIILTTKEQYELENRDFRALQDADFPS
jgi:hypothetical protein